MRVSNCQFRRMGRWCGWSTRRSCGTSFTLTRRLTALRSRRERPGVRSSFGRLEWAEDQQLIGVEEIDGVTYLRLIRPDEGYGDDGS